MSAIARSAVVLSLAAAVTGAASAAPPGAAVPLPPPPPGMTLSRPSQTFFVSGKAGFASPLGNGGSAAPVLEVEASTPWRTTPSGIALAWALPLRTMLPSTTDHDGLQSGSSGIELTPTLRASMPLGRSSFSLRTEAGVGVVARWTWTQVDRTFIGRETVTGRNTTMLVRTGVALDWAVRPRLSIAVEPLSYGFDFRGNADWTFAAGATYRL